MTGRVVENIFYRDSTVPFHSVKPNPLSNSMFRSRMLSGSEMTATQEVSIDVAAASGVSELHSTFHKKKRQKSTDRFLNGKYVVAPFFTHLVRV